MTARASPRPAPQRWAVTTVEDRFWLLAHVQRAAREAGLPPPRVAAASVCVSELLTNAVLHGGGGWVRWRVCAGLFTVTVVDHGPGMPSVAEALRDRFSEGAPLGPERLRGARGGLGVGLGAVKRLANVLRIRSRPGCGTCVVVGVGPAQPRPLPLA